MIEIIYFNGVLLNCRKGYDSKNYVKRGMAGRRKRGLKKMKDVNLLFKLVANLHDA